MFVLYMQYFAYLISTVTIQLSSYVIFIIIHIIQNSCTSCVERELSRRKTFPCPICETIVKRVTLSTRTLDDVQCEKDTSWRRRILKM